MIAKTPKTPYYAVIFTTVRSEIDEGYVEMAERMLDLARSQKGFLGEESVRNELGITISYWESLDDIRLWRENSEHKIAQRLGKERWYESYKLRVAKVERDSEFGL